MNTRTVFWGGALVLVLLTALCVLSVGALGMMEAYSDLKLARTAAQRAEDYYTLERLAAERLASVPEGEGDTFTVSYGGQNLTVVVLPGGEVSRWRLWQESFDYESEGVIIWQG